MGLVQTPTRACADCPIPPSGPVDVVVSAAGLALLPAIAIAGMIYGYALFGRSLRSGSVRSIIVGAIGITTGLLAMAVDGYGIDIPVVESLLFPPSLLAVLALVIARLTVVGLVRRTPTLRSGFAIAGVGWAASWTVVLAFTAGARLIAGPTSFNGVDGMLAVLLEALPALPPLALSAIVAFGYPLGIALGREVQHTRERSLVLVGGVMVVCVIARMVSYVPLPGGPAALVPVAVAFLVAGLLLLAAPVVMTGALSEPGQTRIEAPRSA